MDISEKTMKGMELHEQVQITTKGKYPTTFFITRTIGGWIYESSNEPVQFVFVKE